MAGSPAPGTGYPVRLRIDGSRTSMSRLWGIPILGVLVRSILAIPLYLVLGLVSLAVSLTMLVSWIPVLFTGRQAGWVYGVNSFYVDWTARLGAYLLLLVGGYPLSGDFGARVEVDRDQRFSRLWGIPLLGILIRSIVLIPHYIVLAFLGIAVGFLGLVNWIPVLLLGRQAEPIVTLVGGYLRWTARLNAYVLLVASPYPPFSLSD